MDQAGKVGFKHYDEKPEIVYDKELILCDVVGTFNENRFTFRSEQISKEVSRQQPRTNWKINL